MDANTINIGENIKKYRELKNITREQMAADLGLSLSGYGKIERNETDLTISRIQQIAQILQVEMSQILNFDVSQIFNFTNPQFVQGAGAKAENMHFHTDDYTQKYIKVLEGEVERLKRALGEI